MQLKFGSAVAATYEITHLCTFDMRYNAKKFLTQETMTRSEKKKSKLSKSSSTICPRSLGQFYIK